MSNKIWHKTLHKRKIWKKLSIYRKVRHYMQPFAEHLVDIWYQPLPFPTILKLLQSFVVILMALIPVIYPILLLMLTYAELQIILSSAESNFIFLIAYTIAMLTNLPLRMLSPKNKPRISHLLILGFRVALPAQSFGNLHQIEIALIFMMPIFFFVVQSIK